MRGFVSVKPTVRGSVGVEPTCVCAERTHTDAPAPTPTPTPAGSVGTGTEATWAQVAHVVGACEDSQIPRGIQSFTGCWLTTAVSTCKSDTEVTFLRRGLAVVNIILVVLRIEIHEHVQAYRQNAHENPPATRFVTTQTHAATNQGSAKYKEFIDINFLLQF